MQPDRCVTPYLFYSPGKTQSRKNGVNQTKRYQTKHINKSIKRTNENESHTGEPDSPTQLEVLKRRVCQQKAALSEILCEMERVERERENYRILVDSLMVIMRDAAAQAPSLVR